MSCNLFASNSEEMVISKSLEVLSKKEAIWSALTNEHELRQWWGEGVKLEPVIGGIFYEPWGDGQLATGQVIDLKPAVFISFTWQEKYWQGLETTTCTFSLKENLDGTVLDVKHIGWESFEDPIYRAQLIEGFHKGWDFLLLKLKKYLDDKSNSKK